MNKKSFSIASQSRMLCRIAPGAVLFLLVILSNGALRAQNDTVRTLDEVLVRDARAGEHSPFAATTLSRQQLEESKAEVSIPFIVELQPSVVVSGENGRLGETSMRIRGVDASRINVNINGITLNDPESQSIFWTNIPNLGGMAQSLQVQRGVGNSNGGTASFGGTISLQTLNAAESPYAQADLAAGSWNTRQYGISAGTGISPRGFAFDIAYCGQSTDGFIRGGFADQHSLFATASRYGRRSLLKAVAIIGSQQTGITWNGEDAATLDADPSYNSAGRYTDAFGNVFFYPEESDNYNQRRYQLYYSYLIDSAWSLKAVVDYTHGDGFYEEYKDDRSFAKYNLSTPGKADFIHRKQEANGAYTANLAAQYEGSRATLSFGHTFLYFHADHFGRIVWCQDTALARLLGSQHEWYRNQAVKSDATSYARCDYRLSSRANIYADLQFRYVDYRLNGFADDLFDMDFRERYPFFNPKVGASFRPTDKDRLTFLAALSHREPTRSDIKDAIGRGDTVRPEALLDIELGYTRTLSRASFGTNLYAMLYRDQLTPSGVLSSSGYALMENVDSSYRLGIELFGGVRLAPWLRLDANATLSTNKIVNYRYTDFDEGDSQLRDLVANTDLAYSPNFVGAAVATIEPWGDLKFLLTAKYVGSQYLDNTSRDCFRQDAYLLLNAKVGYTWHLQRGGELEAQLAVNNLLNRSYRIGAWAADDCWDGAYYHYAGWYQQPGTNLLLRLSLRM